MAVVVMAVVCGEIMVMMVIALVLYEGPGNTFTITRLLPKVSTNTVNFFVIIVIP